MIKDDVQASIKEAMKSGNKDRLGTLRMLLSAIKDHEINNRVTATDSDILGIFRKSIKTRRDSIESFKSGGLEYLVAKESAEIDVIESFMPPAIDESEIAAAVDAVLAETQARLQGALTMKEMGAVMKGTMAKLAARGGADGGTVNRIVKERLSALMQGKN